jgi:hypothetical protein
MKECREEAAFKVENYESINLWKETHTQLFSPAYPILERAALGLNRSGIPESARF